MNIQTIRSPRLGRGRLRRVALAAALAATATAGVGVPFGTTPAQAASENKLPKSTLEIIHSETWGDSGDIAMPDCGSWNIEGRRGYAEWTIESSLGSGSSVFEGTEWDVKVSMYVDNLDAKPWLYNDGPDPLWLMLAPTGPVELAENEAVLPAHLGVHDPYGGDWYVGPKGAISTWGYAFDNNSEPTLDGLYQQTSDGVDLTFRVRMRATGTGTVKLPKLEIGGWDSTPPAAEIGCDVPLNWSWNVIDTDAPSVKGENVKTDTSYFWDNIDPQYVGERNDGSHALEIDVLANDDDLNTPGGVGSTDELRIWDHSLNSAQGGNVSCGPGIFQASDFEDMYAGPCRYDPPVGFVGVDSFNYTVQQASDGKRTDGKVTINVLPNQRPQTIEAQLYVDPETDEVFDVSGYMGDPKGEELTCSTTIVAENSPLGSFSMNNDCTFEWDSTAPGSGPQTFTYRVCDTHPLVADHGTNAVRAANYNNGFVGDLSANTSRRCTTGDVTLIVEDVLFLPPVAALDFTQTDAWYGPGLNPNMELFLPLANDYTPNGGVAPDTAEILSFPDPATEGQAIMNGQILQFIAATGAEGEVSFTYRACSSDTDLCGVGKVVVEILPNAAPEPADDWRVVAQPFQVVDFDVSANDNEPDGEALTCTEISAPSDPALVASYSLGPDCLLDVDPADGQTGAVTFTYEVCDEHLLLSGDTGSRCAEASVLVTIINPLIIDNPEQLPPVEPGPEGPPDPTDPPADTLPPDTTVPPVDTTVVPPTPPAPSSAEIPSPGELPQTGGNAGTIALLGGLMVLLGGLVVLTTRRRTKA